MIIGSPCEIKLNEKKIALTPSLVQTLTDSGHNVVIQKGLGLKAGFSDEEYAKCGAEILNSAAEVYSKSKIIVKINPPLIDEYDLLQPFQTIFAFFNYSNKNSLMETIIEKKITTVSYSRIIDNSGKYPFIKAGSEIVGKTLIRIASETAEKYMGGALLGGATGVAPMKFLIIGAGTVGYNAAKIASAIGADVSVLDTDFEVLRKIEKLPYNNIKTYFSDKKTIDSLLSSADIVICSTRNTKKQPPVITENQVAKMKRNSLIIDTGIASGNISVETIDRILTEDNPIYNKQGVLHYCVADIASMAANTIAAAMSGLLSKYLLAVSDKKDFIDALKECRELISGVLTYNGKITDEITAEHFDEKVYELSLLTGC